MFPMNWMYTSMTCSAERSAPATFAFTTTSSTKIPICCLPRAPTVPLTQLRTIGDVRLVRVATGAPQLTAPMSDLLPGFSSRQAITKAQEIKDLLLVYSPPFAVFEGWGTLQRDLVTLPAHAALGMCCRRLTRSAPMHPVLCPRC